MADIFISYSNEDKTTVKQIAGLLQNKGWTVWWDRDIPIGQNFDTIIEQELNAAVCVIVIWTKRSVNSEWVKNEAGEAAQKKKLLPIVLEQVKIPLAFRRIESAMLTGWDGYENHPELDNLYHSVENIINKPALPPPPLPEKSRPYKIIGCISLTALAAFVYCYFYFFNNTAVTGNLFYHYLLIFLISITAGILLYCILNIYAVRQNGMINPRYRVPAIIMSLVMGLLGVLLLIPSARAANITIRLFDWKKNPIAQGDVKIYLREYVRTQSVDKTGQALFTELPPEMFEQKIKIEITSPGYVSRNLDTMVAGLKPLEVIMPLSTVVFISGQVKTAAEIPINNVEIVADGTKYFATSRNDGSYKLRLDEYTLGDEITLTTSHKDYEDKTIAVKIESPEITKKDIVLNPVTRVPKQPN